MKSGRERMMASINALTGQGDCQEAVLAKQARVWIRFVLFVLFIGAVIVLRIPPVGSMVLGAIVRVATSVVFNTNWVIARTTTHLIVARSSQMSARAVAIHRVFPLPLPGPVSTPGSLVLKVRLADDRYIVSRLFADRLHFILGPTVVPAPPPVARGLAFPHPPGFAPPPMAPPLPAPPGPNFLGPPHH